MKQVFAEDFISPEEMLYQFESKIKCKASGVIQKTDSEKNANNDCYGTFYMTLSQGDTQYKVKGSDSYADCIGMATTFPIYDPQVGIYYPQVGEDFYTIVEEKSNNVLKTGKREYDSYPEIPVCQGVTKFSPAIDSYSLIGMLFGGLGIIAICIFWYIIFRKGRKNKTYS